VQRIGGKPVIVFVECSDQNLRVQGWATSTQWGPAVAPLMRGPTLMEMLAEIDACERLGCGRAYFPDRIGNAWEGFDGTTDELSGAMSVRNRVASDSAGGRP
jgi:hypothetical protein